jgi:acetolactate synthase I/III small subunit
MEKTLYTVTVFTENIVGLLNQITIIFTRRHINIESLTVSQSSLPGIHKFTITAETDENMIRKVVRQIEKRIDVLKAYYLTDDEVIYQEVALYKIPSDSLLDNPEIENLVRKYNARILEVNRSYAVIELTGHTEDTQELFNELSKFRVLQFVRSGRIAITKSTVERLSDFLAEMETRNIPNPCEK